MANTIKQRPVEPILAELASKGFDPLGPLCIALRDIITRADKIANNNGEIQSKTNITGRTEQISTTLQNVDSAGKLTTADAIASDGATFGRVHVTALTSNNVDLSKSGVTNKTAANIAETANLKWRQTAHSTTQPTGITITGADVGAGVASVLVSAFTQQVPGVTSYPITGLLNLALLSSTTYYCSLDDPNFDGAGNVIGMSSNPDNLFANSGRSYIGTVTTPAIGGAPTTGKPGGTGGGRNIGTVLA